MDFVYPSGATPIDPNELAGLIPAITTQQELNQLEGNNIRLGYRWALKSRKLKRELLTPEGVKLLHKKMFGDVWSWAGTFRTTEKNIGTVLSYQVAEEVYKLCSDTQYRIDQGVDDWTGIAVWCHHRMVAIHPFSNGNGRHSRMFVDILLVYNQQKPLSWGRSDLCSNDALRRNYIEALRKADAGNLSGLIEFACNKEGRRD